MLFNLNNSPSTELLVRKCEKCGYLFAGTIYQGCSICAIIVEKDLEKSKEDGEEIENENPS